MLKIDVSKEELKDYPIKAYSGTLLYAKTHEDLDALWPDFYEGFHEFGIDTETKPNFKKGQSNPTALMQICNGKTVLIARLYDGILPKQLLQFFNDEKILKLGIATGDDMKELKRTNPMLVPKNVLDLGKMALKKSLLCAGAKRLSALLLGFTISKSQQTSNWENPTLTSAQLSYAATDAWICNLIYDKLKHI